MRLRVSQLALVGVAALRPHKGYLLASAGAIQEIVIDVDGEPQKGNYTGAVNVGAGLGLGDGRADLRMTQSFLLFSGNVGSRAALGVAHFFLGRIRCATLAPGVP